MLMNSQGLRRSAQGQQGSALDGAWEPEGEMSKWPLTRTLSTIDNQFLFASGFLQGSLAGEINWNA